MPDWQVKVLDDPRTPADLAVDRQTIARQVELVNVRRGDVGLQRQARKRLVRDRGRRRGIDTQLTVLEEDGDGVLAAAGELLIADDDLREVADQLRAAGMTTRPVSELDGSVHRVIGGDPKRSFRDQFRGATRRRGGPLRPNFVTPMGIVMKSLCGPENSAVRGPKRPDPAPAQHPVQVAVIDTGVAALGRSDGWLFGLQVSSNADPLDVSEPFGRLDLGAGHGTFAAGVVQQLAPDADLRIYRALGSDGLGTELDVALAMVRAAKLGADVINLSLGFETDDDEEPVALRAAIDLIPDEVLIVAAAGNTGRRRKCWPGAFDRVTSVAALTQGRQPAQWSTSGDWVKCSTIGEGVWSTYVPGTEDDLVDPHGPDTFDALDPWALWTGTSFAAPQVAGAVAQLVQRDGCTPVQARDQLLKQGHDSRDGYGVKLQILPPT